MVRAAAMAAFSVTRRNPISRLDSMKFLRRFDRAHSSSKAAVLPIFVCVALFCELGVPLVYACGGAMAYALIPTFVDHAVQPVSDVVASFYSIVAIWLALRASRVAPAIVPAALSGVAFAIGVWVRPTNFLLVIALVFALRWKPRSLFAAAIAAAPIGLALAWWNKTLYGSPF